MFADQLIQLRKSKKMTQEMLAEKCDVSRQAVAKWESGESLPDVVKLVLIADTFQISLDELVRGKNGAEDKKATARRIYNLFVENIESLRSELLRSSGGYFSDQKLAVQLRTLIKQAKFLYPPKVIEELLALTIDFGVYKGTVEARNKALVPEKPESYYGEKLQMTADAITAAIYDRLDAVLSEYYD